MAGRIIYQQQSFELKPGGNWLRLPRKEAWLDAIYRVLEQWFDDSPVMKLYTSGTTASPKKIIFQKHNMALGAQLTAQHFNMFSNTQALCCLPAEYIAGKMMIIRAIVNEWDLFIQAPSSCPLHPNLPPIDFAALTPMQMAKSIENTEVIAQRINTIILGGAPVGKHLKQRLQHYPNRLYETYGMTETITHIATRKINGEDRSEHFTCLPGVRYQWDERKCLTIEADHLPEKVITNDRVEPVDFESFELLGRIDHVVNSGGVKIHPEQLEDQLGDWFDVAFYFSGRSDEELGEKLVLYLEREPLDPRSEKLLMSSMREELGSIRSPKEIIYLPVFERTASGKIIREHK